jgi:NAD(P)-dependent dehydrogenase (short-subunit alcohol dehydrogenase family)
MRVLLGARDETKGEAAARELARDGDDVQAVVLDVTDAASIHALQERLAGVDVLVNNAGIDYDTDESAVSADLSRVRKIFETNLFGAWAIAEAFAPGMRKRHWGRSSMSVAARGVSRQWIAGCQDTVRRKPR